MPTLLRIQLLKVRYSRWFGETVSLVLFILGLGLVLVSRRQSAKLLMLSHRNSFSEQGQLRREVWLKRLRLLDSHIIESLIPPHEPLEEAVYHRRVIKLKEPNGREKGVILLKFLDTFSWFCRNYNIKRVLTDYYIALELSYYGTCRPEVLQYTAFSDFPVIVGANHPLEAGFLKRLNSNLVTASYNSCTWIDDRTFFPTPSEKEYDCIMVATWNPVKRHYLLFEALTKITDPSYRALVIGGAYGGTREEIEAQIDYYGVRNKVTVMEDVLQKDINILFSKSRVNVMLSLKEGGNKAIIEGMFADTPALILSDHVGINFDWINDQTGRIVEPSQLADALLWFKQSKHSFSPSTWAKEHISCRVSSQKLEQTIKEIARQKQEPWTHGLAMKYNHGSTPKYYNEQDALTPFEFDKFLKTALPSQTAKA